MKSSTRKIQMNMSQESNRIRNLVECTPRAGLPNFFAKLERGGEVQIGYLGGSITAQPGWRVKSLNYFQQQYPQAKLVEIHAAIGGTGSDLGVLRIDHDVLKKNRISSSSNSPSTTPTISRRTSSPVSKASFVKRGRPFRFATSASSTHSPIMRSVFLTTSKRAGSIDLPLRWKPWLTIIRFPASTSVSRSFGLSRRAC